MTVSDCGRIFTDSGESTANYSDNENETFTLCPDDVTKLVSVNFTSFAVHLTDFLYIYDGSDTSTLLGVYNNSNSANGLTFTSTDATGCLTFVFTSNGATNFAGWDC